MNKKLKKTPSLEDLSLLAFKILTKLQQPNTSLRAALAYYRKRWYPRNNHVWGQLHTWIMEVEKRHITINLIEQILLGRQIRGTLKTIMDLATYWRYWGGYKLEKIQKLTLDLIQQQHMRIPRWFTTYFQKLAQHSLKDIAAQITDKDLQWSFKYSLTTVVYHYLSTVYTKKELEELGQYFLTIPPKYFIINPIEKNPTSVLNKLKSQFSFTQVWSDPPIYRYEKGLPLQQSGMYHQGRVLYQDLAAHLSTSFLPLRPQMTVLDVCAAPGNKTLQLAAKQPQITIYAGDLPGNRAKLLLTRLKFFLGQKYTQIPAKSTTSQIIKIPSMESQIIITEWDARHLDFPTNSIDAVFLDAPCTGTGTLGTKPDLRKELTEEFIISHIQLQAELLTESARTVKKNGYLLYVTCSLLQEENEAQINSFLTTHPSWKIVPLHHPLATSSKSLKGSIRFYPPNSQSEGFYCALLQKTKADLQN